MKQAKPKQPPQAIGWREWLALPALGIQAIKAKIDTGARSSCLHAFSIKQFERDDRTWVRFKVHPIQRDSKTTMEVEAEVLEFRKVRSSSGHANVRPVILTPITWLDQSWNVEITLASRDEMGFRMLLGREAVRGRFVVDAGNSWYGGKPEQAVRKKKSNKKKDIS